MDSKLSRWCEGVMEAGWLVAVIAVPLFFNIHSSRVFEPDKLTLLRSVALLMVVAWLVRFIDQRGWQGAGWLRWGEPSSIWRMPFILPVFLLVLVYLLTSALSVAPRSSFLGSYQRLQGTYSTLAYIVLFAVMASTLRRREQLDRLITTVVVTSIPVALYAMLQHFSRDPLPWGGNTQARVAGHMGNSIFVAAYLIMTVPLTIARIADAFTNILEDERLSLADVVRSSIYIFAVFVQLLAIYWTRSRGPWLGLLVGLFAFVLIVLVSLRNAAGGGGMSLVEAGKATLFVLAGAGLLFVALELLLRAVVDAGIFSALEGPFGSFVAFAGAFLVITLAILVLAAARRGWRWLWLSFMIVALLSAVWLAAFNLVDRFPRPWADSPVLGPVVRTLTEWRDVPSIGRLGKLLEAESGTGKVRVLIWQGAFDLIEPHAPLQYPDGSQDRFNFLRPLLGYGPESMYVAYNRFYPPELATVEARNASPDRSHNETIDSLVISGLVGFLVWQLLYLAVFYYGFSWLGVVRRRRDRVALIGLWVGGAAVSGVLFSLTLGLTYVGVAVPFGSIIGLILYLIYYALAGHGPEEEGATDPFQADRLIMVGLVSAVLAHYVEIHFGIAIAATRTHFFVYLGLIFLLGYLLPRQAEETENGPAVAELPAKSRRRRRRRAGSSRQTSLPPWAGPALASAFIMMLLIGILGYDYTTYSLPEGERIASIEDVPTAGEVFHQSMFVNAQREFEDSPYIFLLIILTWALGSLLLLSEMARSGQLPLVAGGERGQPEREQAAAILFVSWAVLGLLLRFVFIDASGASILGLLGRSAMLVWAALSGLSASFLFRRHPLARLGAVTVATLGLVAAAASLVAGGGWIAVLLLASCAGVLALLREEGKRFAVMPALVVTLLSLAGGFAYTYLQAFELRASFLPPASLTAQTTETVRRVMEADQAAGILTIFYVFTFLLILALATTLSLPRWFKARPWGRGSAYLALFLLVPLAFYAIDSTNLNVIQADIVYKRAEPWERQASRNGDPAAWDNAIAIYEHAVELAPNEDFYYLFLGRAYLEQAALRADDRVAQEALLNTADERLKRAQVINPLNTDHTANLARLNTRWADSVSGSEREERLADAERYYNSALALSPQNAIIRNEQARLAYAFRRDCDKAVALYDLSEQIDPYYVDTRLEKADVYVACAADKQGDEQRAMYQAAIASLREGLEMPVTRRQAGSQEQPRPWVQLGQLYQQLSQFEEAIRAYTQARAFANRSFPAWNTDFQIATAYQQMGRTEQAIAFTEQALNEAPDNRQDQLRAFLAQLRGEPVPQPESTTPSAPSLRLIEGERPLAALEAASRNNFYDQYPPMVIDPEKQYEAVMRTSHGDMRLRLFAAEAPLAVNNFIYLATQGFYDGLTFHRVLEGFMAQGGDPTGQGSGGPGYRFADETGNGLAFDQPGRLAMANAGPDTNGSQFFITFAPTPWLDGQHTIFGQLIEGADVLATIRLRDPATDSQPGDVIERIDIYEGQR